MRLDKYLVEHGLVTSRQKAKELITSGEVYVDGNLVNKASAHVSDENVVTIEGEPLAYPSRAGLKLAKAIEVFQIDVCGQVALDVGASTGGFTSCLLQKGAQKVYAVDVGVDQLIRDLRNDPRVVSMEKTNIRDLTVQMLGEPVDLVTVDVSFISLRLVFPHILQLLKPQGQIIALIKPQFETGGKGLNKQGIITEKAIHLEYVPPLIGELQQMGFELLGFHSSPITGSKGNLEYLAYFQLGSSDQKCRELVFDVIRKAWGST